MEIFFILLVLISGSLQVPRQPLPPCDDYLALNDVDIDFEVDIYLWFYKYSSYTWKPIVLGNTTVFSDYKLKYFLFYNSDAFDLFDCVNNPDKLTKTIRKDRNGYYIHF